MTYRDDIERDLEKRLLNRLSTGINGFDRAWLNPSLYESSLDNSLVLSDFEEFICGEAVYSHRIVAYSESELGAFLDRQCEKIEEFMYLRLKGLNCERIGYNESKISFDLGYRYVKITLEYSVLEW